LDLGGRGRKTRNDALFIKEEDEKKSRRRSQEEEVKEKEVNSLNSSKYTEY